MAVLHLHVVVVALVVIQSLSGNAVNAVFSRIGEHRVEVRIPDMPGATAVTLKAVLSDHPTGRLVGNYTKSLERTAAGWWRTVLSDVTNDEVLAHCVITYRLIDQDVEHASSQLIHRYLSTSLDLFGAPHHLRRRAHTVFYDDFNSGHIDGNKWTHDVSADGVGNHEFQMYTPEARNSYVKNGVLYLKPTLTVDRFGQDFLWNGEFDARKVYGTCTNNDCYRKGWNEIHPVMSALVRSSGQIRYGRVEVVAQLPKGDWIWPAIWMMPRGQDYGWWPRSGEIDIMEAMGNMHMTYSNGDSAGPALDRAHIHYGPDPARQKSVGNNFRLSGSTFADGFHTYWLDWTEHYIKIGVDEHTVFARDTPSHGYWQDGGWSGDNLWAHGGSDAPFDKPFYLILNVAIGGDFFWDGYRNHPYDKPWKSGDQEKMMYFWNARHDWLPTWNGEDTALKIKSVKMDQY